MIWSSFFVHVQSGPLFARQLEAAGVEVYQSVPFDEGNFTDADLGVVRRAEIRSHNYIGHNYIGHNYTGPNYVGP